MVGGGKYESIGNSIKELIKKEEKKENRGWQPTPADV